MTTAVNNPASTQGLLQKIEAAVRDGKLMAPAGQNLRTWLTGGFLPAWATSGIAELVNANEWTELNDRFYKSMAFGTGGMRGRTIGRVTAASEVGKPGPLGTPEHASVGTNVLNDFNVVKATIGLYRYCAKYLEQCCTRGDVPKLVIAHDVRHFSRHFCELAASTWTKLGGRALIFDGPRSTPQLSFSVRYLGATAGIVISASHNPPHDNGLKVYFEDGAQVVSPHAEAIIAEVNRVELKDLPPFLEKDISRIVTVPKAAEDAYLNVLEDVVIDPALLRSQKPKVVFTPIHGTGQVMSVPIMRRFGLEPILVDEQMSMDPRFPTVKSPNPEYAEALSMAIAKAKATGADVVMATDPDDDRMGVAVRNRAGDMELFTGNMIGSVLAEYRVSKLKDTGLIPAEGSDAVAIIKTFVTTPLQEAIARAHGLKVVNCLTGFKWIGEKLRIYESQLRDRLLAAEGIALDYDACPYRARALLLQEYSTFFVFGGEESYGYLSSEAVRDKDGNAAVIMFCELAAHLKKQGLTFPEYLDSLYVKYGFYLEDLVNIYYEGAAGAAKIKRIIDSYRSNPPTELAGVQVAKFTDFGQEDLFDADNKLIPKENFYFLELANGYSFAVRGSGTEPKIKFYVFANEKVGDASKLPAVKAETRKKLNELMKAIEADSAKRADG